MDLAVKNIELINWLTTQDETMIKKVDALRRSSMESAYLTRMGENLESKLTRSKADRKSGKTHSQEDVENFFKSKWDR